MKLLVIGDSLGPRAERLRLAAQGLALRGHEVLWTGPLPSRRPSVTRDEGAWPEGPSIRHVPQGWRLARIGADVVVSGGSPARTAFSGWLAGAHAMVLALESPAIERWTALDRWCWESLDAVGIREPGASEIETDAWSPIEPASLVTWPAEPPPITPSASHPDTELLERLGERPRARLQGGAPRAAAFLDRDGTLVVKRDYLASSAGLDLLPGVPEALRRLQAAGLALVVISNQSGVGRGLFSLEQAYETMAGVRILLRRHGVELDGIYFCPHQPDEGCACRKPGTALLERAAWDLGLSLRHSVMFGDRLLDVLTGQRAGGRGVLLRTGNAPEQEERAIPDLPRAPDWVSDDLASAVDWLLGREDWQGTA